MNIGQNSRKMGRWRLLDIISILTGFFDDFPFQKIREITETQADVFSLSFNMKCLKFEKNR